VSKDGLDFEQTEELVKNQAESGKLMTIVSVFIAFSLFITGHAVYSIYSHWVDDSIPLVSCPQSFENDSPVLLKPILQTDSVYSRDRWIRGFVRKVVLNAYPRNAEDAQPFFEFMRDHSEGEVRAKYEAFLADITVIKTMISGGSSIRFYPKDSNEVRIREESKGSVWVVEIDGYLVKSTSGEQERSKPTLRMVLEARPATRSNPNGLVVVEFDKDQIADYVSGRKESKVKETDKDEKK